MSAIVAILALALLAGCGGGGSATEERGGVAITVTWPERTDDRLIPEASNSILVQIFENGILFGEALMVRPVSPPWTTTATITGVLATADALLQAQAFPEDDGTGVAQAAADMHIVIPAGGTAYPLGGEVGDPLALTMASTIDHIDISPNPLTIAQGETMQLTATARDASDAVVLVRATDPFEWTVVSGESYASVGQWTGLVTAVAPGAAVIEVTEQESGKSGQVDATVTAGPGRIVFRSTRDGNSEIYVMDADGANQTRLTNNAVEDSQPCWSRDGRKIAFSSGRDYNYEIYVTDQNGANQTRLTNNGAYSWHPSWSPDGSQIAFASTYDGNCEIYMIDTDGNNQTRVTQSADYDYDPNWSPDGSQIAFMSVLGTDYEIYVIDTDGEHQTNLTNNAAQDYFPNWSPDGRQIAFTSRRDGNPQIYVMDSDGAKVTRLTNNAFYDYDPSWSPDGSQIAFVSSRDGNDEIYVMNADGSGQTRLTNNSAWDQFPCWGIVPAGT